jgi:pimeloyl-ACP methyl ester carboxylesterase
MDAEPTYLSTDRAGLACFLHRGADAKKTPILICGPWGWDEVATYRVRRRWAEHLAAAGHPTLRFDLPAVGDSSGSPADRDLVDAWIESVVTAAAWLAGATGWETVGGLGLGLGGLLLRAAIERDAAIDQLAIWAAPTAGKSFVREARAFARLQTRSESETDDRSLPDGWLDVGGFNLSAGTVAELKALDPVGTGRLRRALLLGRDGVAVDDALVERFERSSIEVETGVGAGWGAMVVDARLAALPAETVAAFDAWLTAAAQPAPPAPAPVELERTLRVDMGERAIKERPITFDLSFGRAFGILTETDDPAAGPCAVFLNSGNVRHIGPNRLWVEVARRWAAETGLPALRLDLEAIGEADGPESKEALFAEDVGELYIPSFLGQIDAVLGSLEQAGIGSTFVLTGLCAGSYWAFQAAVHDRRVVSAVLLNPGALTWDDDLLADRATRGARLAARRTITRDWWLRLLRGGVDLRTLWPHLRSLIQRTFRSRRNGGSPSGAGSRIDLIEAGLDDLRERGTPVVLAFSGDEVMTEDLEEAGFADRVSRWPQLRLMDLPGSDHTLRSPSAQAAVHSIFAAEVERVRRSQDAQLGRQR